MGIISDILTGIPTNAVLREKIEAIEAKYAALDTENAILRDTNRTLNVENQQLRDEINSLRKIIDGCLELQIQVPAIDEIAQKLLVTLAHHNDSPSEYLARVLQISPAKLDYYIQDLIANEYLDSVLVGPNRSHYRLDQKGREYLREHNLL